MLKIKTVRFLDSNLRRKINQFRINTPGVQGRKRTVEEQKIHDDKYCSDKDIKRWVLAFENNQLVGQISVFEREISFANTNIKLGGIGRVRVATSQRRKGIASKMMVEAMKELKSLECAVAFLGTNLDSFLVDFYQKFGFIVLGRTYTYRGKSSKKYFGNDAMLAPINSDRIFYKILNSSQPIDLGVGNW